jgi:hypothetical protein
VERGEIRDQVRDWLDDTTTFQTLYGNGSLDRYLNEAVREACIRARLKVDSTTAGLTQIPVFAGTASYPIDPHIIFARRVGFLSVDGQREYALDRTTYDMLDNRQSYEFRRFGNRNWKLWTTAEPYWVVQDLEERTLRLVGIPQGNPGDPAGTMQLTVVRYPLEAEEMDDDGDEPAIDYQHHMFLAHWAVFRAALKKDADTYDKALSSEHYALFEAHFGKKPTAQEIRAMAHDRAGEIHTYEY